MPTWRYSAIDRAGAAINGTVEAADEATVLRQLRKDGALPLSVTQSRGGLLGSIGAALSASAGGGTALSRQEVTNLTRELTTMLGAGQDLDRALRFLVETAAALGVSRASSANSATRSATAARSPPRSAAAPAASPACMSAWSAPARPAAT